jgi:uncharacterized protein (TIGR02266 family)
MQPNVIAIRFRLQYPDVETFIAKYAANISEGGIFIASMDPPEVGALVRFELSIAGGLTLLHGEGDVVWTTPFDPLRPMAACGMSLRLQRVDADGQALIARVLAYKAAHPQQFVTAAPDPYASVAYRPKPPTQVPSVAAPPSQRHRSLAPPAEVPLAPTPTHERVATAVAEAPVAAVPENSATPATAPASTISSAATPTEPRPDPPPAAKTTPAPVDSELANLLKPRAKSMVTPTDASRRLAELLDRRLRPSRS